MVAFKAIISRPAAVCGVIVWLVLVTCAAECQPAKQEPAGQSAAVEKDGKMSSVQQLEDMLARGDWKAVEAAKQLGGAGWPAIKAGAGMPGYLSRQIAMVCAGSVGGEEAGPVLTAGLSDAEINVALAAAGALSRNPPQSAKGVVLQKLSGDGEPGIRELLALAAGRLGGADTMNVLRPIAAGTDSVAEHARMALARLGDANARKVFVAKLSAAEPAARYECLEQMEYINDKTTAPEIKKLLSDRAAARMIGHEYRRQYRRVCDQAVDTLVSLLKLAPSFKTSVEKIYSDKELEAIRSLAK